MPAAPASFYDVLGAFPEATPSQIRQAYRKAAKRWHPDKAHPDDKALSEKRFKEIAEAYEVLSEVPFRRLYDLYLRCAEFGYVEVTDPEDASGATLMQVPIRDWPHFRETFGGSGGLNADAFQSAAARARYEEDAVGAGDEPPVSCTEWCIAGGILFGIWWFLSWRYQRRQWLNALPPRLWELHSEYAAPMGILLSPFFFGNVPFKDAADWMNAAIGEVFEHDD
mmetsp:Transcript_10131/g.26012  ORF Transcript_10131/g.26012 Transcript_10131/m.26012 type:complete len:224 (-) Transcript_10131:67-738(-)